MFPPEFTQLAHWPQGFKAAVAELAARAEPEPWGKNNRILVNYLRYTYRLVRESGLLPHQDAPYFVLPLGLLTPQQWHLLGVFEKRRATDRPWRFLGWVDESQLPPGVELPRRPVLAELFDTQLRISKRTDHLPGDAQKAVDKARQLVQDDRRIAVPQYWPKTSSIQFLLPFYQGNKVTGALVLQKTAYRDGTGCYYALKSVLPLELAYQNARLLGRVKSNWLVCP
jgi:hypothetical protein